MRKGFKTLAPALILSLLTTAAVAGQGDPQGDEVVQALYDLVDGDPFVQRPAARFLGERGDLDAVPFMVATIRYDPFRNETLIEVLEKLLCFQDQVDFRQA